MTPTLLHDEDGMVYACPECDNAPVYERERDNTQYDRDAKYVCYECGTGVDDPVERPEKPGGAGPDLPPGLNEEMKAKIRAGWKGGDPDADSAGTTFNGP